MCVCVCVCVCDIHDDQSRSSLMCMSLQVPAEICGGAAFPRAT